MSANRRLRRRAARPRGDLRAALLLYLAAAACMLAAGLFSRFLTPAGRVWLSAACSVGGFGMTALAGLTRIDGDRTELLSLRRLSAGQTLWLYAVGVTAVFPAQLFSLLLEGIARAFGAGAPAALPAGDASALLPALLVSGLLAPACEELFFRGYMQGALAAHPAAGRHAPVMTALLFACAHGVGAQWPVLFALGLLFSALGARTRSLFAPVIAHSLYNITLVLLAYSGAGAFLAVLTPLSALALMAGCAGFAYAMGRLWRARGVRGEARFDKETSPVGRYTGLLLAAMILAQAACMLAAWAAEVTAG